MQILINTFHMGKEVDNKEYLHFKNSVLIKNLKAESSTDPLDSSLSLS